MSKQLIPFATADISTLARCLREQLAELERPPTHVEMLNLLAKAGGHVNFQHLRADAAAKGRLSAEPPDADMVDHARVEKVLRHFDNAGRMIRWPGRTNHQDLCLWVIWARLPAAETLSEPEVNQIIIAAHLFGDHAILRRSLVDAGMLTRTQDGRTYRRIEKQPPPDALALLAALARRAMT